MSIRRVLRQPTLVLISCAFFVSAASAAGTVSLTTPGSAYTQDFNTLASSGLPTGWDFSESGTNANAAYNSSTGSSTTGDTYSFGAAGNAERAFGGLLSNTLVPTIGAQFTNNTGAAIESLVIRYTGEQWRVGVPDRGAADRLDFQLSTNASSLNTGNWVDYDSLDFSSPHILAAVAGALDGNAEGNRSAVSFLVSGLSLVDGSSFWIRWQDFNIASSDDGLAVDDFSLIPTETLISPVPEPGMLVLLGIGLAALAVVCNVARLSASPCSSVSRRAGGWEGTGRK